MKFLILDDDQIVLRMLSFALKKFFFDSEVQVVSNAKDALDLVFSHQYTPDIIITDYMMPDMNGISFAEKIKKWGIETGHFVYILMITGSPKKETQIAALKVVDDFVPKPVDMDILISRLSVAVRNTGLIQEKESLVSRNQQYFRHMEELNVMNEKLVGKLSEIIENMAVSLSEAIEYKDLSTSHHVLRVGHLSEALSKELNTGIEPDNLKYGGFFHDIGKIGIPDNILQKPGRLTENEFNVVKRHSEIGAEILKPIGLFKGILDGVRHHHERFDGRGYPAGLEADQIPVMSRVISVADTFDVICSKRPYKEASSLEEAREEILKNSGSQFDPDVAAAFDRLYRQGGVHEIYEKLTR